MIQVKKKRFIVILLILTITNISIVSNAQTVEPNFKDLFDGHGAIMLLLDSETGAIEYANQTAANFYGYSREQLEGMNVSDVSMLKADKIIPRFSEAINGEKNYFVVEHKLFNEDIRTVEIYPYPYMLDDREMLFTVINDITEQVQLRDKNRKINYMISIGFFVIILILILLSFILFRNYKRFAKINTELMENKEQLRLILDSTAEAIYGIDNNGRCTFCNTSCLKILGYKYQDELIGKNMHELIHYSYKDGTPMEIDRCKINKAFLIGKGTHIEDEVFWRADGTCFDVKYSSYPQYKDGEIIGAVVTFTDITERKQVEEEIKYLSYHDSLTGLYNRMFFQEELRRLDTQRNLPISIIVGDVNGLKLKNDVFGHAAGDELLKKVAEIFKKVCRADDIIAREGGDEFIVLLTNTKAIEAEKIIARIKNEFSKEQMLTLKGSISMGSDTKTSVEQDITSIIEAAEDKMYMEKTINRKRVYSNQIRTIMKTLYSRNPREKKHSQNVSELCGKIGRAMDLSDEEIKRLEDAGFYHDIGKIALDENKINNHTNLTEQEKKEIKQHSVVGYRILNLFDETLNLAESVLAHHERWDGSGYPKGLKGKEIPKLARIIAVAESYDSMTNEMNSNIISKEEALERIKSRAGIKFDPKVVDTFLNLMMEN